jgi:hypothetical protein
MNEPFPVVDVTNWPRQREEEIGSKAKFWCRDTEENLWLYKYARTNTGEHWSEKIAEVIAARLQIPHAQVDLATCDGSSGSICLDFTCETETGTLVHGNELLVEIDPTYPSERFYRLAQHTLSSIMFALRQDFVAMAAVPLPAGIDAAVDVFVGYLLLDALVGNTDRHHQNWGILEFEPQNSSVSRLANLAPSYDHASSLGRELNDEARRQIISGATRTIDMYARGSKSRSAIYKSTADKKPLQMFDVFFAAAHENAQAADAWLSQLSLITRDWLSSMVSRVPSSAMSQTARDFVVEHVESNRVALLARKCDYE